jgi:hypothetical protein
VYTLGKDNSRVDTLSWWSDIAKTKKIMKFMILKIYEDRSLEPLKELRRLKMSIGIEVPEEL